MSISNTRTGTEWSRRLVARLAEQGVIATVDGLSALAEAAERSKPVGAVLAERGLADPQLVLAELAQLSGAGSIDIFEVRPAAEAFKLVPEMLARENGAIGYRIENERLILASGEPLSPDLLRSLAGLIDHEVAGYVLADPAGIERIMDAVFPRLTDSAQAPSDDGAAGRRLGDRTSERAAGRRLGDQPPTGGAPGTPDSTWAAPAIAGTSLPIPPPPATLSSSVPPPPPAATAPGHVPPATAAGHMPPAPSPLGGDTLTPSPSTMAAGAPVYDAPLYDAPPAPATPETETTGQTPGAAVAAGAVAAYPEDAKPAAAGGATRGDWNQQAEPEKVPELDLDELLTYAVEHGASDLHLTNQLPPTIRVDGSLRPIEGLPRLDNEQIRGMIYRILTQSYRERFEATKELDAAHMIHGVGRFRLNVFQQRGSVGAVLRAIPHDIPPFDALGLPDVVAGFAELRRGLVLVTGPTGSGKSTSLASLVNIINATKALHIMTVEDPIEFLHSHKRAIVNQREVGTDTESFSEALRHVLRQDPDVILVGEMRDIETISTALTAAETGHLVFATLHTQDAPQTIDRIIDVFPTAQQDQVRIQLAGCLEAVVTQQLIITSGGLGRVAVAEVMVCSPAIRNLIRSAKTHQIYSLMQTGAAIGMQTMDQSLAKAVKAGRITEAVAYDRCHDPSELRDHLKG